MITKIHTRLISDVVQKARSSRRKRCNHNFHASLAEPFHRFLNALEPGTYVRPHRHSEPEKIEVFLVLRGRILVAEFDDEGQVIDHVILDPAVGSYGAEIPPHTWHTLIALESGSVAYEITQGPYTTEDKTFAEWAPPEGDAGAEEFRRKILKETGIEYHKERD